MIRAAGLSRLRITAGAAALAAIAACSQTEALAPVGGDQLAEVRFASIDVLLAAGVEILTAPVCEAAGNGDVSCAGTTVTGDAITVVSLESNASNMTVKVGDRTVYAGSIAEVLDAHSRSGS